MKERHSLKRPSIVGLTEFKMIVGGLQNTRRDNFICVTVGGITANRAVDNVKGNEFVKSEPLQS